MKRLFLLLFVLYADIVAASAGLYLPSVLSDNMVLQHSAKVRLWGKAAPGKTVSISPSWSDETVRATADKDSIWMTEVLTPAPGGPHSIIFMEGSEKIEISNILSGEVWICAGQSNMSMPVKGFQSQPINGSLDEILESAASGDRIRMFTASRSISLKKEFDVSGKWFPAGLNTTGNFSAVGYFFAKYLSESLEVPVGMINLSWGGSNVQAWSSRELLETYPEIDLSKIDMSSRSPQRICTALHNAMFCPISRFSVKGIIWYQGENNVYEPDLYSRLFPDMVKEWRDVIGLGDIPFYYVQISPFSYGNPDGYDAAIFREVQWRSQFVIPNSGIAVTADLGEKDQIHYAKKKDVGKRLALLALACTYGYDGLPCKGPVYRRYEIDGNKMILTFDSVAGGLILKEPDAADMVFEIAGNDRVFVPAEVTAEGSRLIMHSDKVPQPRYARYAFRNYSAAVLFDGAGLPAAPFRTDNF